MTAEAYVMELDRPGAVLVMRDGEQLVPLFLGRDAYAGDDRAIPDCLDQSKVTRVRLDSDRNTVEYLAPSGDWRHWVPEHIFSTVNALIGSHREAKWERVRRFAETLRKTEVPT